MALKPGEVKACPSEGQSTGDDSSYFMTTPGHAQEPTQGTPSTLHPKRAHRPQSASTYRTGVSLFRDRRPGKEEGQVHNTEKQKARSVSSSWLLCFASSRVLKWAVAWLPESPRVSQGRAIR